MAAILKSRAPAITAAGERPLPPPLRPIGSRSGTGPPSRPGCLLNGRFPDAPLPAPASTETQGLWRLSSLS